MGGFIVGFDSDPPDIFERQIEFVERAAIPWAMTGLLQAPPTTPLYERMKREGRLLQDNPEPSNFDPPNFRFVPSSSSGRGSTVRKFGGSKLLGSGLS